MHSVTLNKATRTRPACSCYDQPHATAVMLSTQVVDTYAPSADSTTRRQLLTVEANIACDVVGDSGVLKLLLLGPLSALPCFASSTRLDTWTAQYTSQPMLLANSGGCGGYACAMHAMLHCTFTYNTYQLLRVWQRQPLQKQLIQLELRAWVHRMVIQSLATWCW